MNEAKLFSNQSDAGILGACVGGSSRLRGGAHIARSAEISGLEVAAQHHRDLAALELHPDARRIHAQRADQGLAGLVGMAALVEQRRLRGHRRRRCGPALARAQAGRVAIGAADQSREQLPGRPSGDRAGRRGLYVAARDPLVAGRVAEWLCRGLQSPVHRFNSGPGLQRFTVCS